MRFYLRTDRLPELARLSKSQRQFVYLQGIHPLLRRWPVVVSDFVLFFVLFMVSGHWLQAETKGFSWRWLTWLTIAFICVGHLHAMFWISFKRPAIRRFILEHQPEIEALP